MPELTLQFKTAPGADSAAIAQQLQSQLAQVSGVENAGAQAMESRDLSTDAALVMGFLTVAPMVIDKATALIASIKNFIQASGDLHTAIVEIRGRRIPVAGLKPADLGAEPSH